MAERGKIKWFNLTKGFGFIARGNHQGDAFVHITAIQDGYTPKEGDNVNFNICKGEKGPQAIDVRLANSSSELTKTATPASKPASKEPSQKRKTEVKGDTKSKNNFSGHGVNNLREGGGLFLPKNTRKAIGAGKPDNFSLALNRTPFYDGQKFILYREQDSKKEIAGFDIRKHIDWSEYAHLIPQLIKRQKQTIESVATSTETLTFNPDWRTIVGLGGASVYETAMTLHHIYGFPYLPGQALKGITRRHIIKEVFDGEEEFKANGALSDPLFCALFGCPKDSVLEEAHQGSIAFFDSFPKAFQSCSIDIDIMTPHYSDYYQDPKGIVQPADYFDPGPIIHFITVGSKIEFDVTVGIIRDKEQSADKYSNSKLCKATREPSLLGTARTWLKKALVEHGIGAKGSVGYGYGLFAE